jgi:hypothetical protein
MKNWIIIVAVALAGCGAEPVKLQTPDIPVIAPTRVEVAIREKCSVQLPAEPVWDTETVAVNASKLEKSKAALTELERRRAYESQIKAEAKKCE